MTIEVTVSNFTSGKDGNELSVEGSVCCDHSGENDNYYNNW